MYKPGFSAVFSPCSTPAAHILGCGDGRCRLYRYVLWRVWDESRRTLAVIGLNPSTADEKKDDRTVAKLIRLGKCWGYGSLCMLNLFAWRDTQPSAMKAAAEPVGVENDHWLQLCTAEAGMVLAAWGNHGAFKGRAGTVRGLLRCPMYALKITDLLQPQHPLYLKEDMIPFLLPTM